MRPHRPLPPCCSHRPAVSCRHANCALQHLFHSSQEFQCMWKCMSAVLGASWDGQCGVPWAAACRCRSRSASPREPAQGIGAHPLKIVGELVWLAHVRHTLCQRTAAAPCKGACMGAGRSHHCGQVGGRGEQGWVSDCGGRTATRRQYYVSSKTKAVQCREDCSCRCPARAVNECMHNPPGALHSRDPTPPASASKRSAIAHVAALVS